MRPFRCLLVALACCCIASGAVRGDEEPAPSPAMGERAPVVLDGRVLFEVGKLEAWSPQRRAARVAELLRGAVKGSEPILLVLAEHDGHPIVRMGEWHLFTVAESDVPPGMDRGEQAERWMLIVDQALQRARTERSAAYVWQAGLRGLGAITLAALLYWLLGIAARRLPLRLARVLGRRELPTYGAKAGWQIGIELGCLAAQIFVWVAALLYIVEQFPVLRHGRYLSVRAASAVLETPLLMLNERHYSGYDFLWLVAVVAALWVVVSLVTALIGWRLARATGVSRSALQPTATLLRYGLLLLGVIVVLQLAGINLSSLALLGGVLGVGIGFGLQSIANNFISGVLISFERPVKPGDFVSIGDLQGTVDRIGGRSTVIRTLDRVSIIVPNSKLLETEVVNWSYGDPVARLHLPVGVAYGSDIERVRGALLEAARAHPAVLTQPRPEVRFEAFGDNALNFDLLVWSADPPAQAQLRSDLYFQIEANLRRAGIEIPFPQRTLHLPAAELDALAARLRGEAPSLAPTAAPPSEEIAFTAAPGRIPDVDTLVARLRGAGGIAIADRRHRLTVYPKCFVGAEAVDWLVRTFDLERGEAVRLGQTLVDRGLVHHVLDEHPFRDGGYFYRFYADEVQSDSVER